MNISFQIPDELREFLDGEIVVISEDYNDDMTIIGSKFDDDGKAHEVVLRIRWEAYPSEEIPRLEKVMED